tara:strand:+ start:286 stop:414 length:129 start_codon:yes stop_codon:yes gene_type:complete
MIIIIIATTTIVAPTRITAVIETATITAIYFYLPCVTTSQPE